VQGRFDKFQLPKTTHQDQSVSPFSSATTGPWAGAGTGTTAVLDTSTGGPQPQIFPWLQPRCVPEESPWPDWTDATAETWKSRSFAGERHEP